MRGEGPFQGRGVLYVATGEDYVRAACASAETVRDFSPLLRRHLFCDGGAVGRLPRGLFTSVGVIENPHRRSKVDLIHRTPFDRTLYLDVDTAVVAPVDDVCDLLDRFDIALAHAPRRNDPSTSQLWRVSIPDAFPQCNAGVMAFRSTPPVIRFLQGWQRAYHEAGFKKDQVTLRELLWESGLRLAVLPPEYNIRSVKYIEGVWHEREAKPRILHFRNLVPRKPRDTSLRGRVMSWPGRQVRLARAVLKPIFRRLR